MLLADHNKTALILPDRSYSYAELLAMAHAYAHHIPDGTERVLIFSENRPAWIHAFYGSLVARDARLCRSISRPQPKRLPSLPGIAGPRSFSAPRTANRLSRKSWQCWTMRRNFCF